MVASDGAIWFTDPPYGIVPGFEGRVADAEYDGCYVTGARKAGDPAAATPGRKAR